METLADVYVLAFWELPLNIELEAIKKFVAEGNWKRLPSTKIVRLITVGLAVTVTNIDNPSLALKRGDRGVDVTNLQNQLKAQGCYNGPITGYFGFLTEEAVNKCPEVLGNFLPPPDVSISRQEIDSAELSNNGDRILKRKDWNKYVLELQQGLSRAGYYNAPMTGYFGSHTEAAVKIYQRDNGLQVTGIVDLTTQDNLIAQGIISQRASFPQSETSNAVVLMPNQSNDLVADLQRKLKSLGYLRYDGSLGYFGWMTQEAVTKFQVDNNIYPTDGIVREDTLSAINKMVSSDSRYNTGAVFTKFDLQRRLKAKGFNPGPIDGVIGPQTRKAITLAQNYYGLSADDIINGNF